MTDYKYYEASPHDLRARALLPMIFAAAIVGLSFLLPVSQGLSLINSFDGADKLAIFLSGSAKVFGISIITLALVAILGTRKWLSGQYRLKEAIAIVGAVIVFAGGGALLNEHYLKPQFDSPRPNVEWLAQQPASNESGFSVESYYAKQSGDDRSRMMQKALLAVGADVPTPIGKHWASEPGYSFPSGHAYASFFLATFFLFFATSFVSSNRRSLFILLIPWAIAVCFSRVLLNVHRPIDITVGAVQGLVVGILAWLVVRLIIRKIVQIENDS